MKKLILILGIILLSSMNFVSALNATQMNQLLGHYSFDNMVNSSGTKYYANSVQNKTNATIYSGTFITTGKVVNATSLSGSDTIYFNTASNGLTRTSGRNVSAIFLIYATATGGDKNIFEFGGNLGFSYSKTTDCVCSNLGFCGTPSGWTSFCSGTALPLNQWNQVYVQLNQISGTQQRYFIWLNNVSIYDSGVVNYAMGDGTWDFQNLRQAAITGLMDELVFYNRSLTPDEIAFYYDNTFLKNKTYYSTPYDPVTPLISSINCTSCNIPYGSITPPYTTADTTPTFRFATNGSAYCRISKTQNSYVVMNSSRQCTSGEGMEAHTCTLTSQDELGFPTSYVYLACVNAYNSSYESNATLLMNITNLDINASTMIQQGIQNSVVWPTATVYDNQKIYLRNLNNQQVLTTVNKVVVFGSQRWLIYYSSTNQSIGLFNITPVVYSLELINSPLDQIPSMVQTFINSTKR